MIVMMLRSLSAASSSLQVAHSFALGSGRSTTCCCPSSSSASLGSNSRRVVAASAAWFSSSTIVQPQQTRIEDGGQQQQQQQQQESQKSFVMRKKSLVTGVEGVHQTMKVSKTWRNKPLFRRQGDVRFKTGIEASQLLIEEALRRDSHEKEFIDSLTSNLYCLAPIFDRNPKYAFVAKTLMEPERHIQFRVAWTDDVGVIRMNRGYRIQYSSSLGPYVGGLYFGSQYTDGVIKAMGYDTVFTNALTGLDMGAAVGGSDFNPINKSVGELQRFCQSFMTELSKYVSPNHDLPWMGYGVGPTEMGYLYGQYKRIQPAVPMAGRTFLSGAFPEATGYGIVHFANEMLLDKGDTLEGKRCLILGGDIVARSCAEKLLSYGAIPITFSDESGHVYEPHGMTYEKLKMINKIKDERGALLGRYIISSTTAQFNNPQSILDIPCDLCFPCNGTTRHDIDEYAVDKLADLGCQGIIEGAPSAVSTNARKTLQKRGLLYGPHNVTLVGSAIVHAACRSTSGTSSSTITTSSSKTTTKDIELQQHVSRIYRDVKSTATEFNARGDLFVGANIIGFLRVANVMMTHGAV